MLREWTLDYIKNRDIVHRRISNVEDKGDYFLVTHKDESHIIFLVKEDIDDFSNVIDKIDELSKENNPDKITLVLYNNKVNLDSLLKYWKTLSERTNLTIIFANPRANEKWVISPNVHNKIADPETLEQGIKTMFEGVESY